MDPDETSSGQPAETVEPTAPEQEATPASFTPAGADRDAPDESPAREATPSAGAGWFANLLRSKSQGGAVSRARAAAEAGGSDEEQSAAPPPQGKPAAETRPAQAQPPATALLPGSGQPPGHRVVSEEELQRLAQARAADLDARRRQAQAQQAEARRRQEEWSRLEQLRLQDPLAYAEERHAADVRIQQEAAIRQEREAVHRETLERTTRLFDTAVLEPVLMRLTREEQAVVMRTQPQGVKGRTMLIQKALDAIEKRLAEANYQRGLADGEARARSSPALRKQILAELRGRDEDDGADLAPAVGTGRTRGRSTADIANDFLRAGFGRRPGTG